MIDRRVYNHSQGEFILGCIADGGLEFGRWKFKLTDAQVDEFFSYYKQLTEEEEMDLFHKYLDHEYPNSRALRKL